MFISLLDPLKNFINLPFPPVRIVSLVPSLTELLFSLGLESEVVGITKFCIHPQQWFDTKQRVGGTKTVKTASVRALYPDLIIANKEENVKEQIEELKHIAPVYVTDIYTLVDALQTIRAIGMLVNRQERADKLAKEIQSAFDEIKPLNISPGAAYFIWKDPYMAAGGNTFINDMLRRCGFDNVFKDIPRYPQVTIVQQPSSPICQPSTTNSQLSSPNCQLLLLSSEPFPFTEKHIAEMQPQLQGSRMILVDGEMFSWYGSRLLFAASYFQKLISQIQG